MLEAHRIFTDVFNDECSQIKHNEQVNFFGSRINDDDDDDLLN